jgi:hypothetical protein
MIRLQAGADNVEITSDFVQRPQEAILQFALQPTSALRETAVGELAPA